MLCQRTAGTIRKTAESWYKRTESNRGTRRWNEIMRTLEELEKEEKDRQEFIEATNKLKRELKRTQHCIEKTGDS